MEDMEDTYKKIRDWLRGAFKDPESYVDNYKKGLSLLEKLVKPIEGNGISIDEVIKNKGIQDAYYRGLAGYVEKKDYSKNVEEAAEVVSRVSKKIAHKHLLFQEFSKHYFSELSLKKTLAEIDITDTSPEMPLIYALEILMEARRKTVESLHEKIKSFERKHYVEYVPQNWEPDFLEKAEYWRGFSNLVEQELVAYAKKIFGKEAEKAIWLWQGALFMSTSALPRDIRIRELQKPVFELLAKKDWKKAQDKLYEIAKNYPYLFKDWKLEEIGLKDLISEKKKAITSRKILEQRRKVLKAESMIKYELKQGEYTRARELAVSFGFDPVNKLRGLYLEVLEDIFQNTRKYSISSTINFIKLSPNCGCRKEAKDFTLKLIEKCTKKGMVLRANQLEKELF